MKGLRGHGGRVVQGRGTGSKTVGHLTVCMSGCLHRLMGSVVHTITRWLLQSGICAKLSHQ